MYTKTSSINNHPTHEEHVRSNIDTHSFQDIPPTFDRTHSVILFNNLSNQERHITTDTFHIHNMTACSSCTKNPSTEPLNCFSVAPSRRAVRAPAAGRRILRTMQPTCCPLSKRHIYLYMPLREYRTTTTGLLQHHREYPHTESNVII